jgi:hypothetical protein
MKGFPDLYPVGSCVFVLSSTIILYDPADRRASEISHRSKRPIQPIQRQGVALHLRAREGSICGSRSWQNVGQIELLGVHPDHCGKRLGSALERAVCSVLQDQGTRLLYLDHGTLDKKAKAVSLRNGFRQVNTIQRHGIRFVPDYLIGASSRLLLYRVSPTALRAVLRSASPALRAWLDTCSEATAPKGRALPCRMNDGSIERLRRADQGSASCAR